MQKSILFAGFGGQGILFAGKVATYSGLLDDKKVTWLPSYGPEMRGGTANCSVCISEDEIGCPMVFEPNILFVLNSPSYDAFIDKVTSGATVFINTSLINKKPEREDINVIYIPATELASENHLNGLANVIMLGCAVKHGILPEMDIMKKALEKCISKSKSHLIESNFKALHIGFNY